jgi:hypothetical protein
MLPVRTWCTSVLCQASSPLHPPPRLQAPLPVAAGAVGTRGCDCEEAYQGAPRDLQEHYRLACEVCQKQAYEVEEIPLPGLEGICTSCLYSGPVPKNCTAAPPPPSLSQLAPPPPPSRRRL